MDEEERRISNELPTVAVVPVMKRKSYKQLGDPTVQAAQLSGAVKELSPAELLKLAEERRVELEEAGEIDRLGDVMPEKPPELNAAIVGTELEICWRYWRTPTAEEVAGGEKRKKIGVPIWCTGTVTHLANGTTVTTNPDNIRCRALADAGAVRIRWPEDLDREVPEPESFSWHILQNANWNPPRDTHLAWRFTAAELTKRTEAAEAERAPKRQCPGPAAAAPTARGPWPTRPTARM